MMSADEARFQNRHRLVVSMVFGWAAAIVIVAAVLDYGVEHGVTEALIPVGFGVVALWAWPDAWQRVGLATAGLCTAQAITIHLFEGSVWTHFAFFGVAALVVLYHHPAVPWFLVVEIAFIHGGLAYVDPHSVYGHGWPVLARTTLIATQLAGVFALWLATAQRRPKNPLSQHAP